MFFSLTAALGNSHLSESEVDISPRREVLSVIPLSKTPRAAASQKIMPIMFDISHQPLTVKPREKSWEVLIYLFQLFINYFVLSQGCHFMEHSALPQKPLAILWCTRFYEALTDTFRLQNVLSAADIVLPTNFQSSKLNKTYICGLPLITTKNLNWPLTYKKKDIELVGLKAQLNFLLKHL